MSQTQRDHHPLHHQNQHPTDQESLCTTTSATTNICSPPPLLIKITLISFQIFLSYPRIYFTILTLTALPLSLLLSSLSLSTRSLLAHFHHLQYLAAVVSTDVESGNVRDEAHNDAVSVFFLKASYGLPSLLFSLFALTTTVAATCSARNTNNQHPPPHTFRAAFSLVARTWKRPLWTSVVAYVITVFCVHFTHSLLTPLVTGTGTMATVIVVDLVLEVCLMSAITSGLVVSVMEDRSGVEAIRIGAGLMGGTRVSGWLLSGGFLLVSGLIGKQLRMDGEDFVMMKIIYKAGLVVVLALVVLWSYIVGAVYYCECRKRHPLVEEHEDGDDECTS